MTHYTFDMCIYKLIIKNMKLYLKHKPFVRDPVWVDCRHVFWLMPLDGTSTLLCGDMFSQRDKTKTCLKMIFLFDKHFHLGTIEPSICFPVVWSKDWIPWNEALSGIYPTVCLPCGMRTWKIHGLGLNMMSHTMQISPDMVRAVLTLFPGNIIKLSWTYF